MGSNFRGNGWFSKLSYLGMKLACLAIGQNSRSGPYTLLPPGAQKIELILTLPAEVSEILADFQNGHILAWIPEVAHILSFFSNELIFALWAAVFKIRANFQNCHIWAWKLASGQRSRSCRCTLFLPQRVEIERIFALRSAVSKIRANFLTCHIWAWNLASGQSSRSCTWGLKLRLFLLYGQHRKTECTLLVKAALQMHIHLYKCIYHCIHGQNCKNAVTTGDIRLLVGDRDVVIVICNCNM